MPGLSFVANFREGVSANKANILTALDCLLHNSDYEKKILLDEPGYFLATTQYEQYPFMTFETTEFQIHVEGKIYGTDPAKLADELQELATSLFLNSSCSQNKAGAWLERRDGDFVIVFYRKGSGEVAFLNDVLGRLPLYAYHSPADGEFILSRELRFITSQKRFHDFDRMAIAQFLLLGHPLGERTLLQDIRHIGPASFIKISRPTMQVSITHLNLLDFDSKPHSDRTRGANAKELASLFSQACRLRADGLTRNVLALSGGLDSRSVAAGLSANDIPFAAITMDINGTYAADVRIANQLSKIFDVDWKIFELAAPQGRDCLRLLRMKAGLNYLGMSFILPFFERIKETLGSDVNYWTGDGGNKLQIDFRPGQKLQHTYDLAGFIIAKHQVLPLNTVTALTQVTKQDILDDIEALLAAYPENGIDGKYLHFYIFDKTVRWNFEGEDRNRFFFWSVAPFFAVPFFNYLMACPEEQKARHALYRDFLMELSPKALRVDNADWGFSLVSNKYPLMWMVRKYLIDKLDPNFKRRVKASWRRPEAGFYQVVLQNQIRSCQDVEKYLVPSAVESTIKGCGQTELTTLLTVTSAIEDYVRGKSSFEEYAQASFA